MACVQSSGREKGRQAFLHGRGGAGLALQNDGAGLAEGVQAGEAGVEAAQVQAADGKAAAGGGEGAIGPVFLGQWQQIYTNIYICI